MKPSLLQYVSSDTFPLFEKYIQLLKEWNRKTGLVQENTLPDVWERHILDSLQLLPFLSSFSPLIDIGSGGGFPGIVLAIAGRKNITLCESNTRKSVFLEEVLRQLDLKAIVRNARIEDVKEKYEMVVSRACADLSTLLKFMHYVSCETNCTGVFLKGKNVEKEIEIAKDKWMFEVQMPPSITEKEGKVIIINNLKPIRRG